jgi:pfkB family carbohydrate kinase
MPDLLVLGQVTVDHAVPATPGPWYESLGGNALYAAAGARLWCDASRIGIVTRLGRGLARDVAALLGRVGLPAGGLVEADAEPLVEWHLYEPDGSRRSLPRNAALRDPTTDGATLHQRYLAHLEALSPALGDIPAAWLPAPAVHLAPQVAARHGSALPSLARRADWIAVDPSPHYARQLDERQLAGLLRGARAFLPSRAEVEHLAADGDWVALMLRLREAGFEEVVLKLGSDGSLVAAPDAEPPRWIAAAPARVVDLTGAGDAFGGAYAAARLTGLDPLGAGRRGAIAAAMVVECTGAAAALALAPAEAKRRLESWSPSPDRPGRAAGVAQ